MAGILEIGNQILNLSSPIVMGILNVTPDSFYDGGKYMSEVKVIERIHQIVEEGAAIIDVGAYSTRPGASYVDEKEELARLSWAVELIRKYYPKMAVSIDTFRAGVAREIISCQGPVIINDISGGTMDERMFALLAEVQVPYVMMHMQGTPQTMQKNPVYKNVVQEIRNFFIDRIARLNDMNFNRIILDPGFGFGKTLSHNYELMKGMDNYRDLGYPVLVGISRKSMIYKLLDTTPKEALNGTSVLNTIALMKGADILRVHDVKAAVEAVKICTALSS